MPYRCLFCMFWTNRPGYSERTKKTIHYQRMIDHLQQEHGDLLPHALTKGAGFRIADFAAWSDSMDLTGLDRQTAKEDIRAADIQLRKVLGYARYATSPRVARKIELLLRGIADVSREL